MEEKSEVLSTRKEMVGTRRLELLTSTVSKRAIQYLQQLTGLPGTAKYL